MLMKMEILFRKWPLYLMDILYGLMLKINFHLKMSKWSIWTMIILNKTKMLQQMI